MVGEPAAPTEPFELTLGEDDHGERLDRVLARRVPGVSRSTLKRWIDEGRVLVDGAAVAPKDKAVDGARVRVEPAPPPPSKAAPQDIPLAILHEDPHLLVLDKPAGMVVHPAPGHPDGTLVNALLHHVGAPLEGDPLRPGIVHRIDKDTSGVMVVAKTAAARDGLVAAFAAHDIERAYLAIALGRVPERVTYDTLHGRHPGDRKKFTGRVDRGKRAVTHVETLERLHGATLVRCRLETGRTHQIRVHLAEAGHGLLADALYGRPSRDPRLREAAAAIGRQALHATHLGFLHPVDGRPMSFRTEPPADFAAALAALRDDP